MKSIHTYIHCGKHPLLYEFLIKNKLGRIKTFNEFEQIFFVNAYNIAKNITIPIEVINELLDYNFKFVQYLSFNQQVEAMNKMTTFPPQNMEYIKKPNTKKEQLLFPQLLKRIIDLNPFTIKFMQPFWLNKNLCNYAMVKDCNVFPYIPHEYQTLKQLATYQKNITDVKDILKKVYSFIPKFHLKPSDLILDGFGIELEFITYNITLVKLLLKEALHVKFSTIDEEIKNRFMWHMVKDVSAQDMYEVISKKITSIDDFKLLIKVINCLQVLEISGIIKLTDMCGFHIHRDVKKYSYDEVQKIENVYLNNINSIYKLLNSTRKNNKFCITKKCNNLSEEILKNTPVKVLKESRFHAVNTNAYFYYNSIEFRQHETTVSVKEVLSWIEFTAQLVKYHLSVSNNNIFMGPLFKQLNISKGTKTFYKEKYIKNYKLI